MLETLIKRGELSFDHRIREIEEILFKKTSSERNRLFDHIYEKI